MKGKVKFFNELKGFGFIAGDDSKEYFVHSTGLAPGTRLRENDTVEFTVTQGDRGPKAEKVTRTASAAPQSTRVVETSDAPTDDDSDESSDDDSDDENKD